MLVIKFTVLIERGRVQIFEVAFEARVPYLPTHRNLSLEIRRGQGPLVLYDISVGHLLGLVVHEVLVVLGDHLINRRRGPGA